MKVVHVHRMRGIGGSERHLLALLPGLAALGVEPVFVGLDDPAWDPEPFYEQLPVESVRLPMGHELDPRVVGRLRGALRGATSSTRTSSTPTSTARSPRGDRALVSTKHNDDPFRVGVVPLRRARAHPPRGARDRDHRGPEALQRRARRAARGEDRGRPLRPRRAARRLGPRTPALDLPDDARVLLAISRLVPQKGLDIAVRALARVREEEPRAVLVVLGEGPERERLAGDGVYLPGRVGDVSAWLARAELLVHPARWEGFGLALLEAMLAGKPVVATRVSSIPEIVVDGETGRARASRRPRGPRRRDPARAARPGAPRRDGPGPRAQRVLGRADVRRTLAVYERALSSRER